jgi:cellulose synthase/poly-beta-1,6-N-acetylglucosamine synthase-like glycosyltransferase
VQLPLFNERYVAERVIRAAGALDYPRDRLEIQVLDDSTDGTLDVAGREVAELKRRGISAAHIRRRNRAGYKAGALAAGLESARGELVAIFDADFVPPRDFLLRTVGEFADER